MSVATGVIMTGERVVSVAEERRVIVASSVGTVFEWYDFYLYAILAPFFAGLFFPPGNQTAALLGAFGAYAAGFLIRPFGALIFGRIGDIVGRKYTFLVTIVVMGVSTVLVGFMPTYASLGFAAPLVLVALRLAQGLALGGEYGGAATYVAEHAADNKRGYATSWIQTTATLGMLFFLVFGALSDRIGRKKIILAGCIIAALTYFPLFKGLTHFINPDLEAYQQRTPIEVAASDCNFHIFLGPWSRQTACDRAKDFLGKAGLSFTSVPAVPGKEVVTKIGTITIEGWDPPKFVEALKATGYPPKADSSKVNWVAAEIILVIMVIYVTMVYGPIAAFLVELFPTKIRYTSMSLPYHIGNGWFGGMLPLLATALVAWSGNIYYGLWYPIWVSIMTFVIGTFMVRETRHVQIHTEH